jgi:hypothetical protein
LRSYRHIPRRAAHGDERSRSDGNALSRGSASGSADEDARIVIHGDGARNEHPDAGRVNLVTVDTLAWRDTCRRGGTLEVEAAGVTARLVFDAEGFVTVDLNGDDVPEDSFSTCSAPSGCADGDTRSTARPPRSTRALLPLASGPLGYDPTVLRNEPLWPAGGCVHPCAAKVCAAEIRAEEVGAAEIRVSQVCSVEVCPAQQGTRQIRTAKIAAPEGNPRQIGASENALGEIGCAEIDAGKICACKSR